MKTVQTEAEVAADVLITLIRHDQLSGTHLAKALDVTGLTREQLKAASIRRQRAGWAALKLSDCPPSVPQVSPEPDRRRPAPNRNPAPRPTNLRTAPTPRKRREDPDGGEDQLWCTGSVDIAGHWATESAFSVRADKPHLRRSKCDEHMRAYQRTKHVSARALDAFSEAGFKLVLDANSNLVGIGCKECGEPFAPGDQIEAEASLRHVLCQKGSGHGDIVDGEDSA